MRAVAGLVAITPAAGYVTPLASIIIVLVWQWTPFMMLIMLAGLQSQPADVLEAANRSRPQGGSDRRWT